MERRVLWLQSKAEVNSVLQTFAKAAGSHMGCEAIRTLLAVFFPGRNALCAGSPSGKAARSLLGVSFVGWRFSVHQKVVLLKQGYPSQRLV